VCDAVTTSSDILTYSSTGTIVMRFNVRSQGDERPISPDILRSLADLSVSDFVVEENPFAVAEDVALYGAPFYTSRQGPKKAYVVFNGRRMGVFQSW
jgi:hypothetical protein